MLDAQAYRKEILQRVGEFYGHQFPQPVFVGGTSPIPVTGKVFDHEELTALVDSSLDFWLTAGRYAQLFETELARWLGARFCLLCNSGSSANLLAMSALTSPELGQRRLLPGDEVITVAAGFPTTVNPIVFHQLVPVFVDVDPSTANVSIEELARAIGPKTKAIVLAHTLGNPFNLEEVGELSRKHGLWLIEDNCDALGSEYAGKKTGTFGHMATLSFYPAHHITTGEGGAVVTDNAVLRKILLSLRDWGRDCWCDPGKDNTCGKRFAWQLGDLPMGYDHKYIYSHLGYNFKVTDMQAAVGVAQLKKLPGFILKRRRNWQRLYDGLRACEEFFVLPQPTPRSQPSWFGFLLTVREKAPFTKSQIVAHLEARGIATRALFGGNLLKQPAYQGIRCRVVGELAHTDRFMANAFWIGVYPGITDGMVDYMLEVMRAFTQNYPKVK